MLQCSMRVEKDDAGNTVSRHIQDFAGSDMVYTCPGGNIAQLSEVADELAPFDPNAIERKPDPASIEKLMRLPSFRQAYEYDGMWPDEFAHFGAFQATAGEFAKATRATVDFVRMVIEG
jgi:transaldolase